MFEMPDAVVKWLAHSALGGGLLLLLGVLLMGCTRRPARRQRLGELALGSSLLVAALCLFPAYVPWAIPVLPAELDQPREPGQAALPPSFQVDNPNDVHPAQRFEPFLVVIDAGEGVEIPLEWLLATADGLMEFDDAGQRPVLPQGLGVAQARNVALDRPETPASATDVGEQVVGAAPRPWLAFLPWLGAGYLVLTGYFLVRCVVGHVGLQRLMNSSVAPPAGVQRLLAELVGNHRNRPRLRVSPRVSLPLSFGLLRPTILVPSSMCRTGEEAALRLALVHELTHLERRDAWSCLLVTICQAIYFYLPWLWWLRHQVRLCQEYVADAAAAALTRSEDYAQYLLSLAPRPGPDSRSRPWRHTSGPPRLAHVQGIWGTSSDLYRRITMLLDSRRSVERNVPRWWTLAAGAGFVAAAVLVSGVSLTARADDQQDDKKATAKKQADEAKKQLKDALKAYEALVGEKSELNKDQLRDALKLYQALVVDEKDQADGKKKAVEKDEFQKRAADAVKLQSELIRKQADMQVKQAEAALKAAQAQVEIAKKQAEQAAQRAKAQLDEQLKDPAFKDKIKDGKWALEVRPEFFDQQFKGPNSAWLRFHQLDPKTGALFKQTGGRLGLRLEVPGEALTEQLNLAKEQGLVVHDVTADSAAARAGVQKNDIILFFAEQPVTHETDNFVQRVREAKAGEPIEIVVLRKGKRVTLKATLAEAKKDEAGQEDQANPLFQKVQPSPNVNQFQFGQPFAQPGLGQPGVFGQNQPFIWNPNVNANVNSVITTTVRRDDRFTTRHQEGSLIITITGTVDAGKAKVNQIVVQDGGVEKKYESVDKVADQYKDKVKDLVESSESGQVRVKVKSAK